MPVPTVVPLDRFLMPAELDGRGGHNRVTGAAQIAATDDRSAVLAWLANYADSPATLASYRKEVERLLLWCVLQHGKALSDLSHEDLLIYQRFLADPQPSERWVIRGGQRPARSSPDWRPFAGPLSTSSQRQASSVLNSLFGWLVEARYLRGNPLALSRRRRTQRTPSRVTRFLPMAHWVEVKRTVEALPMDTARQRAHAARTRWLLTLLYIGGLRVSEVCAGTMGGFFSRLSQDGRDRWWLEVLGKGQKLRLIPATPELMDELTRYRLACGLSPLPCTGDPTPLVLPLIGAALPMQRTGIHAIVKGPHDGDGRSAEGDWGPAHDERCRTHRPGIDPLASPHGRHAPEQWHGPQSSSRQPRAWQHRHHEHLPSRRGRRASRCDIDGPQGRVDGLGA